MKKDLEGRKDIEVLLEAFYRKAFADAMIGHFFTEVVPLNLEQHIPVIADFWESVVFSVHGYRKNVMEVHQHIHRLSPIEKEHLDRWVQLFSSTVDEMFAGDKATLMKQRAASIATLMQIKLGGREAIGFRN
jgi:hemoglobin